MLGWIASIHWYVEEVATCSPCGNLRTTKGQHMGKYITDSCLLPVAPWYIYCTLLILVPILKIPFSKNHLCERVMWDQIIRRGPKNNPPPPRHTPSEVTAGSIRIHHIKLDSSIPVCVYIYIYSHFFLHCFPSNIPLISIK